MTQGCYAQINRFPRVFREATTSPANRLAGVGWKATL
jgi:hypothetical protein